MRTAVTEARRVVLKLGTRVLTHNDGRIAMGRLFGVVEEAAALRRAGKQVLLVSSGAVGLGVDALGMERPPEDLVERQACAAVGQSRLMELYQQCFARMGLVCGQVLLTQADFDDRDRYLNLRSTMEALLRLGVVPIINENDVVSTDELDVSDVVGNGSAGARPVFGDNDTLSALVAVKLGADLLVLLTDVDGVYDKDPGVHEDAHLIPELDDAGLKRVAAGGSRSGIGRGGMRSKVEAARVAHGGGCHTVIASGRRPEALARVLRGEPEGTWIPAGEGRSARLGWIAFAAASRGSLHLDEGAVRAVTERGASLLAAGVTRVEGRFKRGDVVELLGPDGAVLGRGAVHCDAASARDWCTGRAPDGARNRHALVHRDNLVLTDKSTGNPS